MLKQFNLIKSRVVESPDQQGDILLYINPTEAEKKDLVEKLHIDEHTLVSALDPDELSRIEFEPDHLAVIFKRPRQFSADDNRLLFRVSSTGLFLFGDRLVIVMLEDLPLFDSRLFQRISTLSDVALKLIYRSIFHFLEHLKVVNMISDDLERKINASMDNRYIIHLFGLEKSLVYYLNSINSNGALIEKLRLNSSKLHFTPDQAEFIDDMIIENTQCYKQAEIHSNILASLMDARASIVGNNLNVLMKNLTLITIGIMVPTFVVSAFSMNVRIPMSDIHYAFWFILLLALLSMASFFLIWRHKHW